MVENKENHLLLDVRSPVQFRICSLPNSTSIPLDKLESQLPGLKEQIEKQNAENGKHKGFAFLFFFYLSTIKFILFLHYQFM